MTESRPEMENNDPPPGSEVDQARGSTAFMGMTVLVSLVLFAAFWMRHQSIGAISPDQAEVHTLPGDLSKDLDGFRFDAWYLPDEELLGFVEIPAGSFVMGSNPAVDRFAYENERWSNTRLQGTVDLRTFYIGVYEVTVRQFQAFVEATEYSIEGQVLEGAPDHPVVNVSWTDALAYSRWLETTLEEWPETPLSLRRILTDGGRVSLPSEAEWEKAARGTAGRIYPWGNQPRSDRANYGGDGITPVGSFDCPECAFGLSDMSGNVWELTRSPYQPYPYDAGDDRDNLEADALWVMRGGSFSDEENNIRAAIRGGVDPGVRSPTIGFRLVISRF